MKIAILTRGSNPWVYFLLNLIEPAHDVLVVNESTPAPRHLWARAKFRRRRGWLVAGDLLLQDLAAMLASLRRRFRRPKVVTAPISAIDIREHPLAFRRILAQLAQSFSPSVKRQWHNFESLQSHEVLRLLRNYAPEAILLCAAPIVRLKRFAEFAPIINAHCGIVPEYRGSSPTHWAAYRRDWDRIGFTLHLATDAVDGGPIIEQQTVTPHSNWTLVDLDWHLVRSMYETMAGIINSGELQSKVARARPQEPGIPSRPPMGLIRSRIAEYRLRRYLRSERPQ